MSELFVSANCSSSSVENPVFGSHGRDKPCTKSVPSVSSGEIDTQSTLLLEITTVLEEQGVNVVARADDVAKFTNKIVYGLETRRRWLNELQEPEKHFGHTDIITWIKQAQLDGDIDEALWRVFLATHFGRTSCDDPPNAPDSASRFLCGYGTAAVWTWQKVSTGLGGLRRWLEQHRAEVTTLKFGNHRKHETNSEPEELFKVLESIVEWVKRNGGTPQIALSTAGATSSQAAFKLLYQRLMGHPSSHGRGIYRFGRTACFDMLVLIGDLELAPVRPGSVYLQGATGPLTGAQQLWGAKHSYIVLELRAETLAKRIEVPICVIEWSYPGLVDR